MCVTFNRSKLVTSMLPQQILVPFSSGSKLQDACHAIGPSVGRNSKKREDPCFEIAHQLDGLRLVRVLPGILVEAHNCRLSPTGHVGA
jgi:hypothetical protein